MASRAKWRATPGLKELFIDLCVQEVNQDGRLDRSLKPHSWHRIVEGIDKAFEDCKFTQKQLKNEWDYLKRQFLIWYKLTNAAGYDYDEESQTINWTEERWKAYIKRAPDAKQFRSKPLQCAEQLQLLFESTLASPHTSDTSDDLLDIDIGSSREIVNWEDNGNSTPGKPISAPGTTSRAKWKSTPGLKELFIELCLQEVNQDGRHGKSLKSHSWRRIGKEIAETFEDCKFSQRQLKNEWDYLQRQYQVWYKLTNSPGHGYDEASKTFNWPEEKWKVFIKRFPEAKQFRKKPLLCVDQLKFLFECTLDRTGIPVDSPDVDIGSSHTSVNLDDNANYAPGKPIAGAVVAEMTGQRSEKRRKKNEDDDDDDAIEEVRGILKLIKSFKAQMDEGPTIADCLKALNQLRVEVKLEPQVYGAALRSFCKGKEYRSLFMMLGCNEDKVLNYLKLNCDGAWSAETNSGGLGWILRGSFVAAGAEGISPRTASEAEAATILMGLKEAKKSRVKKLVVESDAKILIQCINERKTEGNIATCNLLVDIYSHLVYFDCINFQFAPRYCNRAAHVLAHWASCSNLSELWLSPPIWLMAVIEEENLIAPVQVP